MRRRLHLFLGLILILPTTAVAREAGAPPNVIVLPFANYTGRFEAVDAVLPVFYSKVQIGGFRVVTHEELRPILRQYRTRVVGEIGTRAIDVLREATGAEFAVVGSVDVFEPERSLEVMVSARVIDLRTHRMITAVSVGRIVQETERAFGRGRAVEVDEIVQDVVDAFIAEIRPVLEETAASAPRGHHNCGLVAVIPLDDYSSRRHGAKVLENLLIAELVARGWTVVEPGVVRELLLEHQLAARGGISGEVVSVLRDELGTCFLFTGEVERFDLAPTGFEAAIPHLGYGIRVVDGRNGRLLNAVNESRDGLEGETLLGRGREYSMASLARTSIHDLLEELDPERGR